MEVFMYFKDISKIIKVYEKKEKKILIKTIIKLKNR